MLYGTAFEQETDTADAAFVAAEPVPLAVRVMEARQDAWTVAETLIEALAVAAATGLIVEPDARTQKAKTDNVVFMVTALPPARTNT
jgi:hypothetical protein